MHRVQTSARAPIGGIATAHEPKEKRAHDRDRRATATELEAAAFRRLVEHLRERTDVQNIDLMNLAGFCRNCLVELVPGGGRRARAHTISKDEAREIVYGMPYKEWQERYQTEASPAVQAAFLKSGSGGHKP